jgi:DNA-binding response OmpR family regulator
MFERQADCSSFVRRADLPAMEMAERSFFSDDDQVPAWIRSEMKDAFGGATILLVEDDADISDLMDTLLRLAGFEPTVCSNAEMGLEQLREHPFDLVLTDYALPNRTGGWMIRQAKAEGLLEATPVVVVTAHPNPPDIEGYEVICKPFDLDHLVTRVKQQLDGNGRRRTAIPAVKAVSGRPGDSNGDGDCPDPVELILYVSSYSPKSAAAINNIKSVLSRYQSSRVNLTIYDLSQNPEAGRADSVAFTPTLVKRSPGPRTFILGHISNPDVLVELLQACGGEAK